MKKITKIVALNLLIGPILYSYFFPWTTVHIDTLLFLVIGIFLLYYNLSNKIRINCPKFFKTYVLYACLVPLIGFLLYGKLSPWLSSLITILLFYVVFINSIPYLNYNLIKSYYKRIVYFSCVIFLAQEIMYFILGYRFSALIPFMDVAYNYTDTAAFIARQVHLDRGSSIFLEPAHFAQYISGYIALCLSEKADEGSLKITEPAILSIMLIFTWSGNSILALICIWGLYLFKLHIKSYIKYSVVFPSVIVICVYAFSYISNTEKGSDLINRQKELDTEQSYVSSGMMRIFRGYMVYEDMPNPLKVLGVGTGYIPDVIDHSSYNRMFHTFERYVNNIQTLLIGNGLFGTVLFCLFLLKLCQRKNRLPLFMVILFLSFCFIESFWCTSKMFLYLGLAAVSISKINT